MSSYGYSNSAYYPTPPTQPAGAGAPPPSSAPTGPPAGYGTTAPYGSYSSSNTPSTNYPSYDQMKPQATNYYSQPPANGGSAPPPAGPPPSQPQSNYAAPSYQGYPPPSGPPQSAPGAYNSYPPPSGAPPPAPSNGSSWGPPPTDGGYGSRPPPRNNGNGAPYGSAPPSYNDRGDYRRDDNRSGGYQDDLRDAPWSGAPADSDCIFITGLPKDVTEDQISQYFGTIGLIKEDRHSKRPKIWIYRDKASGEGKGEATVTFVDQQTAKSSIQWFNGKVMPGTSSVLKIEFAQRKGFDNNRGGGFRGGRGGDRGNFRGGRGGGSGRGGFGSGYPSREGDWKCPDPECGNDNFSWRNQCNRCKASKPPGAGAPSDGGDQGRDGGSYGGRGDGGYPREGGYRGRGGDRGGDRGGFRGGFRDDFRGGYRGRGGFNGSPGGDRPYPGRDDRPDAGRGGYRGGPMRDNNFDRRPRPY